MIDAVTDTTSMVWLLFVGADRVVWIVATLLSVIAGYILHSYTDDTLLSVTIASALLMSIMAAHVAFTMLGIMFLTDRTANMVAAGGAALCAVTAIALVTLRLIIAIGTPHDRLKGGA